MSTELKQSKKRRGMKVSDLIMCISLVLVLVSGFMIRPLQMSGEHLRLLMICGICHVLFALVFTVMCVMHMVRHGLFRTVRED